MVLVKVVHGGGSGPTSYAADRFDGAARCRTVDNRRNPSEMGVPGLKHVDADASSDTSGGGVATTFENADPAHRCQIMKRRDNITLPSYRGAMASWH